MPCFPSPHGHHAMSLGLGKRERSSKGLAALSPQVPNNRNVKVFFKLFYLLEPSVPVGTCPKDYVEVNGEK